MNYWQHGFWHERLKFQGALVMQQTYTHVPMLSLRPSPTAWVRTAKGWREGKMSWNMKCPRRPLPGQRDCPSKHSELGKRREGIPKDIFWTFRESMAAATWRPRTDTRLARSPEETEPQVELKTQRTLHEPWKGHQSFKAERVIPVLKTNSSVVKPKAECQNLVRAEQPWRPRQH